MEMHATISSACLDDFHQFCKSLNVRTVIAAANEQGQLEGFEKEVYALAILRAVKNGDFGEDHEATLMAITKIWEQGYRKGFNEESFNEVFQELFVCW
jgi:hypothetical protein